MLISLPETILQNSRSVVYKNLKIITFVYIFFNFWLLFSQKIKNNLVLNVSFLIP